MSVAEPVVQPEGEEPANAQLFRAVNERIRELSAPGASEYEFMCECDDGRCTMVLRLSEAEYERVRSEPAHFVVLAGHEWPLDEVVATGDGWAVVRKRREEP